MGNKKGRNEERFYPIVLKYLKQNGYLTESYKDDGKTKFEFTRVGGKTQADVVGVKDVGRDYSHEIEIVAIEVKDRDQARVRYITQALGYSTFAHRCYLAMSTKYSEEYINYARQMGVGLLEIGEDKVKKEVLSAELKNPDETMMIWFLRRSLHLVKCVFCGTIIYRFYNKQTKYIERRNVFGKEKTLFICLECHKMLKLTARKGSEVIK